MARSAILTPRDRLDRILDYVRKARRYWWLVAVATIVGGALSAAFAVTRPAVYKSWASLFYQERIQSSVLGREAQAVQRDIGDRYRELLLARSQLEKIVNDPELGFGKQIAKVGVDEVIDDLRLNIVFASRGANTFRITYSDSEKERAHLVTARLTALLQEKEESIRQDQAQNTARFAEQQKATATEELRASQRKLSEFLAKHPEFVADNSQGSQEGASIRAAAKKGSSSSGSSGNSREAALERQVSRIKARLAAPVGPAPVREPKAPSAERIAADAAVAEAKRELAAAERDLEAARAKFTDKHPDVVDARDKVAAAQQRVRRAEAQVPPDEVDDEVALAPTSDADRAALEQELADLEGRLSSLRSKNRTGDAGSAAAVTARDDAATNWVVERETEYAELRRAVDEQRERVQTLSDSVARAQIDAGIQMAEQGSRLTVVDPAFLPSKPFGKGPKLLIIAGTLVFVALGAVLALGLAILDDRLYRRADIDELALAPVLAVIPPMAKGGKRGPARKARAGGKRASTEVL